MKIQVDLGEDTIEIKKAKLCCVKECEKYATRNLCQLGMCEKHANQMAD